MRKMILLLIILFFSLFDIAYASEQINSFDTYILVNKNASIDVTEIINTYTDGTRKLGVFYRRLPVIHYQDRYGNLQARKYEVNKVLFNNSTTPYLLQTKNNIFTISIGNENTLLDRGNHIYFIQYHVNNAVNFLPEHDAFYWKLGVNNWGIPILNAKITIYLPDQAQISKAFANTGSREIIKNYAITFPEKNVMEVVTTQTLNPGGDLSAAVTWQKGIVMPPGWLKVMMQQLNPNDFIVVALALLTFTYYLLTWYLLVGRSRNKIITPLSEPPKNLTPAAMRYIFRMGFDTKTLTTAIVHMATTGYLKIENINDRFTLKKNKTTEITLPAEEEVLAFELFKKNNVVALSQDNSTQLKIAKQKFKFNLAMSYKKKYFISNISYLLFGITLTLLAFSLVIWSSDDASIAITNKLLLIILTSVTFYAFYQSWVFVKASRYKSLKSMIKATPYLLAYIAWIYSNYYLITLSIPIVDESVLTIVCLFFMLWLNIIFYFLLKVATPEGEIIINKIKGFRSYLSNIDGPKKTPELFEKYLSYAIALNLEHEWSMQFENALRKTGIKSAWYDDPSSSTFANFPVMLTMGLGISLNSTVYDGLYYSTTPDW